jgi:DNA mismatch repair ATPase MutS
LAQLMMQCGMFAAATSYEATVCRGVFTHFRTAEDATMQLGKLEEELARMSGLADQLLGNCLVLFNEPFASTNETEGSEIGLHVVRALCERNVKVAIVTHLFPLARALHADPGDTALFLEAERLPAGERTFRLREGWPVPTGHAEDLYRQIFSAPPDHCIGADLCRAEGGKQD